MPSRPWRPPSPPPRIMREPTPPQPAGTEDTLLPETAKRQGRCSESDTRLVSLLGSGTVQVQSARSHPYKRQEQGAHDERKKAEANRRNALKSTGPKTPEGKE